MSLDRHNVEPEPGTVAWIVTEHGMLRRALREEKFNRELAAVLYRKIEQSDAGRLLSDMNGRLFASFDAFCKSSNGLELEPAPHRAGTDAARCAASRLGARLRTGTYGLSRINRGYGRAYYRETHPASQGRPYRPL
jgi:hypothetical protein